MTRDRRRALRRWGARQQRSDVVTEQQPSPEPAPEEQAPPEPEAPPPPGSAPGPHLDRADRARVGILEAVRRHWLMVLVITLLLTGAGVGLALARAPIFEATTRLNVDFRAQSPSALPGALTAARALTDSYSRALASADVLRAISRQSELEPQEVAERVTATPVPDSTVIQVIADGDSEDEAAVLANQASRSLVSYVRALDDPNEELVQSVLADFRRAAAQYDRRLTELQQLEDGAPANPSPEATAAMQRAEVATQTALLKRETVSQRFASSQQAFVADLLPLDRAQGADSDHIEMLQLLGFLGLVAGLSVGALLATARANRA